MTSGKLQKLNNYSDSLVILSFTIVLAKKYPTSKQKHKSTVQSEIDIRKMEISQDKIILQKGKLSPRPTDPLFF